MIKVSKNDRSTRYKAPQTKPNTDVPIRRPPDEIIVSDDYRLTFVSAV
jgi:hypothetical protein